jgi:hypothetical protein
MDEAASMCWPRPGCHWLPTCPPLNNTYIKMLDYPACFCFFDYLAMPSTFNPLASRVDSDMEATPC